jgi:hypothetical protein
MMELQEQVNRQRVQHIVSSYRLAGSEAEEFNCFLEELLQIYPTGLLELALTETLVDHWLNVPLLRGIAFLSQVHQRLQLWETQAIATTLTPDQFQQITGLDPRPAFESVQTLSPQMT